MLIGITSFNRWSFGIPTPLGIRTIMLLHTKSGILHVIPNDNYAKRGFANRHYSKLSAPDGIGILIENTFNVGIDPFGIMPIGRTAFSTVVVWHNLGILKRRNVMVVMPNNYSDK